jgi:hypothetical protein
MGQPAIAIVNRAACGCAIAKLGTIVSIIWLSLLFLGTEYSHYPPNGSFTPRPRYGKALHPDTQIQIM